MTRSRFGFQTALLAGCLSLLAVGCGDDGTPQAMTEKDKPGETPEQMKEREEQEKLAEGCKTNPQSDPSCPGYVTPPKPPMPMAALDGILETDAQKLNAAKSIQNVLSRPDKDGERSALLDEGISQIIDTFKGTSPTASTAQAIIQAIDTTPRHRSGATRASGTNKASSGQQWFPSTLSADVKDRLVVDIESSYSTKSKHALKFYETGDTQQVASHGVGNRPGQSDYYSAMTQIRTEENALGFGLDTTDMVDTKDMMLDNFGFPSSFETMILKKENVNVKYDDKNYQATIYAELYSNQNRDGEFKGDDNYLAGGVWMIIPDKADYAAGYKAGAFAKNAPLFKATLSTGETTSFTQSSVPDSFTGTAEFKGNALGLHSSMDGGNGTAVVSRLTGNVMITANFLDAQDAGYVEGSINGLKMNGKDMDGSISLTRINMKNDTGTNKASNNTSSHVSPGNITIGSLGGEPYNGSWGLSFGGSTADNAGASQVSGVVQGNSGMDKAFIMSYFGRKTK